jgi:hypothetical protein
LPSAFWQTTLFLNFFSLIGECVSTALTALWLQHSQVKPRFHYLLLIQCDWEICLSVCGIALKKLKPFSAFFVHS